ncbi:hypothetical protein [Halogeometricum limi]|uniref:Glycosyl hydrolases family 43 n=1 Tax=Halogeometricum limi TaxID=555875 RepID=A0A1I6I9V3_9EURY|nr:hypothetical protein [Halogeometricum limi]SFR63476.1 hypothetical protein SAMN04488124_2905 [Halogeometricum limi]
MYATAPTVDFGEAETLLAPDETGQGNWVGAPCSYRHGETTYLAVRERDTDRRGHRVVVYEYDDGIGDVALEVTAEALGVVSIERASLVTHPRTGDVQLYLPLDRGGNDWVIAKCADASSVEAVDPTTARPVLRPRPGETDAGVVKDPAIVTVGGRYYMFYAGADGVSERAHLATSVDGETWTRAEHNPVVERGYWHDHHTRVSAVVPAPDAPVWLAFYDGSGVADEGRTWNLRTGVAVSTDLQTFTDTCPDGPLYSSPAADRRTGLSTFGTCRYLDVLRHGDEWELFAEVAREDGSFELRRATASVPF